MNLLGIPDKARRLPILGTLVGGLVRGIRRVTFPGSEKYWIGYYRSGGDSGPGSYAPELVRFKTDQMNRFISERRIGSAIEFGCGDGHLLEQIQYSIYLGFDVSPAAVEKCRGLFSKDPRKAFKLVSEYQEERAELSVSLDVIYHLVEDGTYREYMERLFRTSTRYVVIYSTDSNTQPRWRAPHVLHRRFTDFVSERLPGWSVTEHVPNPFSISDERDRRTLPDFYLFERS